MKKWISIIVCAALILCTCQSIWAAEPAGGEPGQSQGAEGESGGESAEAPGGSGGGSGGGADQNYGQNNEENSVLVISGGETELQNEEAGTLEIAEGGLIGPEAAEGLYVKGADDHSNGIYICDDRDDAVYTIGGEEGYYTVDGWDRSFNTVIETAGPAEDPDAECWYGVGITSLGGVLNVQNAYIHTCGYRASAIYTPKGDHETNLVVKDCVLAVDGAEKSFMPDFKLMVGSARATLLLGEDIWFYNTDIIARDWGAISHDSNTADIQMYAVNTYAETAAGGYALYALDGTQNYMYGSELISSQYGMIVMGSGTAELDSLAAADEAALQYADGEDFSEPLTGDGKSIVIGGCNAVVFHVNSGILEPGTLTVADAVVSTMPEDLVSKAGSDLHFDLDSYLLSPVKFGESWFYMAECLGSAIVTRSHGAVINIEEGAEIRSASGVLLQTMIAYDSDAGNIFRDSTDDRVLKDVEVCIDTDVEGDILHQDYQRNLFVHINADYTGRIETGSCLSWNRLWSDEGLNTLLEKHGMKDRFELTAETADAVRSCLIREADASAYTDRFGVIVTIAEGFSWTVEGKSSVLQLSISGDGLGGAEGAVHAEKIYVDCAVGEDGFLDETTGTEVEELVPGEYNNVVLIGR